MKYYLLIDDHEIIRSGIKNVLEEFYKPCEVFEASNGESALLLIRERQFQLVIMDVQMPGTQALDLLGVIKIISPRTAVLIFSMSSESGYARRFLNGGALGFVSKDSGLTELKKAITLALADRKYVSAFLAEHLIKDLAAPAIINPFEKLSSREFQIASLLIKGIPMKQIGDMLSIKSSTAATYKTRIFGKLRIKNIIELSDINRIYN